MTSFFGILPKNDVTFGQNPEKWRHRIFENYREYAEISNFHMNRAQDALAACPISLPFYYPFLMTMNYPSVLSKGCAPYNLQ